MTDVIQRDSLIAMIAAPILWAVHFTLVYFAVALRCAVDFFSGEWLGVSTLGWTIGLLTVAAIAGIAVLGLLGYRRWRTSPEHSAPEPAGRQRFLALSALLLSILSIVGVIYTAIPMPLMAPCR